jgi:SOS response associated peptidase (SRAP)
MLSVQGPGCAEHPADRKRGRGRLRSFPGVLQFCSLRRSLGLTKMRELTVVAYNKAGYCVTQVDLYDFLHFVPIGPDAFRRTRCLIPASGYYEWQDTATGKQPWYFTRADGEPMTFAGTNGKTKPRARC